MFFRLRDNKKMTKNQMSSKSQTSFSSPDYQTMTPSICMAMLLISKPIWTILVALDVIGIELQNIFKVQK
jgi:hypothetical protein